MKYLEFDLYQFLEEADFRTIILSGPSHPQWDELDQTLSKSNADYVHAKQILLELQTYFEGQGLPKEVILQKIESRIKTYQSKSNAYVSQRQKILRVYRVAAAVFILISLGIILNWWTRSYQVYQTNNGEQTSITLPDETKVLLNGNSKLTWNRHWKKSQMRRVSLEGEAYFDVTKHDGMTFEVNTEDMTIEVLGTIFNVNSRTQKTDVYLEEGKINLRVKDSAHTQLVMAPGDRVIWTNQHLEKTSGANEDEILAWKNGLLIFKEEPLENVLEDVANIYGKTFSFQDTTLKQRKITTTIPITNWEMTAMALQLAMKIQFEEDENTIKIKEKD